MLSSTGSPAGSPSPPPPQRPSSMTPTSSGKGRSRKAFGSERQFPGKLHSLLDHAVKHNLQHVISWVDNTSFMVHDPEQLLEILPLFFGQTKYRSFQRQLNMWSFQRVLDGPQKGAFTHPYFIRGEKILCRQISRNSFQHPDPDKLDGYKHAAASASESLSLEETRPARGDRRGKNRENISEDSKMPAMDNAFDVLLDRAIRSASSQGSVDSDEEMETEAAGGNSSLSTSMLGSPILLEGARQPAKHPDIEPAAFAFGDQFQTVAQHAIAHPPSAGNSSTSSGKKFFFLDNKQRSETPNPPLARHQEDYATHTLPMMLAGAGIQQYQPTSTTSLPDQDLFGSASGGMFDEGMEHESFSPRPLPPRRSLSATQVTSNMDLFAPPFEPSNPSIHSTISQALAPASFALSPSQSHSVRQQPQPQRAQSSSSLPSNLSPVTSSLTLNQIQQHRRQILQPNVWGQSQLQNQHQGSSNQNEMNQRSEMLQRFIDFQSKDIHRSGSDDDSNEDN